MFGLMRRCSRHSCRRGWNVPAVKPHCSSFNVYTYDDDVDYATTLATCFMIIWHFRLMPRYVPRTAVLGLPWRSDYRNSIASAVRSPTVDL